MIKGKSIKVTSTAVRDRFSISKKAGVDLIVFLELLSKFDLVTERDETNCDGKVRA